MKRTPKILLFILTSLVVALVLNFALHRRSNTVIAKWKQAASVQYKSSDPYYLSVVEGNVDVFNYKLSVRNTGPKAIKEIDWDYVFTDAATGEELGRREFTSVEKLGPGKRKELSVFVSSAPTQRISVYTLGKKERDGLVEQAIVVRISLRRGTAWQAR